jgi:hypothetical protein
MTPVYDEHGKLLGELGVDLDRYTGRSMVILYQKGERFWQVELVVSERVRDDGVVVRVLRADSSHVDVLKKCRSFSPADQ